MKALLIPALILIGTTASAACPLETTGSIGTNAPALTESKVKHLLNQGNGPASPSTTANTGR